MKVKVERTKENDKEVGVLWEEIKMIDEDGNYIVFRKNTCLKETKYRLQDGLIMGTRFYYNDAKGFTKQGRGKVKKEIEDKKNELLNWAYDNIEELRGLSFR